MLIIIAIKVYSKGRMQMYARNLACILTNRNTRVFYQPKMTQKSLPSPLAYSRLIYIASLFAV